MARTESVSAPTARLALRPAALLLLLAAPSWLPGPRPGPVLAETPSGRPPAFELRTVERSLGDCAAGDEAPCARFSARYPVITGGLRPAALEALNRALALRTAQGMTIEEEADAGAAPTIEAAAEEFLAGWRRERAELPDRALGAASWIDERRMTVTFSDHRVLSVELTHLSFTGGAHPNSFTWLESYALDTGEPLELGQLVAPEAEGRLEELAERAFRRQRRVPETASLEEAGFWFEDGRFRLTDNFAVTGAGLTFLFNPYEVAPYALGPTRITLPWSEIAGLLRPDGPVAPPAAAVPRRAA